MSEHTGPGSGDAHPDDEQLAAYLAGELDPVAVRRLERRLTDEDALAARLDVLAETVVELRGVDRVEPPPGYRARLDARLERAWAEAPATAAPARARPRRQWRGPLAAAAAIAALAVAVPVVLQFGATEDAADVTGLARDDAETFEEDAEAPDEAAPEVEADVPEAAEPDADDPEPLPPLRVDPDAEAARDADALWVRYADVPALDAPVDDAPALLDRREAEVRDALDALGAGACAAAVGEAVARESPIIALDRVSVDGEPRLGVLVLLGEGQGRGLLFDLDDCALVADRALER